VRQQPDHALELCHGGFLAENLAGMKERHQFFAEAHGHGRIAQPDLAGHCRGFVMGLLGQLLLHLQTRGAGVAVGRITRRRKIFPPMIVVGNCHDSTGLSATGRPVASVKARA